MFTKYFALLALLTLAGCSTPTTVNSWLDPTSMATITAQTEPLRLGRPQTKGTVNGGDYVRLVAVEVNRMGDRRLYLVAALWSNANLSDKQWQDFENCFRQIEVRTNANPVTLTRHPEPPSKLGVGEWPRPVPGSRQVYYAIERAELRAIAESKDVRLITLGRQDVILSYEVREDGRESLREFLSQLPPEATNNGVARKTLAPASSGGS